MITTNRLFALTLTALTLLANQSAPAGTETTITTKKRIARIPLCQPKVQDEKLYDDILRDTKCRIDSLQKEVEEWGVITVSAPVVMEVKGQFSIETSGSNSFSQREYINFELSNVSGASMVSNETGLTNQLAVSATPTFQANKVTGLPEPVLSTASPDFSKVPPAPLNVSNILSTGSPAAPGGLLSALTATRQNPVRNAVLQGVNDKLTEVILSTMANPRWDNFVNKDYDIYFAVVQVSCNPGWRTRENYIGDLSATCEYFDSKTRTVMPDCEQRSPSVFSVLPLIDAQTLELGSSDRQLLALSAQLAGAYPTVGLSLMGQDLITFVHRHQKDSVTRTPITVTNSYSTGRTFGFRFAPSFRAQKDPAYKRSGAANILQATSFPVLVTIVANQRDAGMTADERFQHYDSIITHVSTNWLINDRPPLRNIFRRLVTPMEREKFSYRIRWAEDMACIHANLIDADCNRVDANGHSRFDFDPVYTTLKSEALQLEAKCVPQQNIFRLEDAVTKQRLDADDKDAEAAAKKAKKEADAAIEKESQIAIHLEYDHSGRVTSVNFDKRTLGNLTPEKLADMIVQLGKCCDASKEKAAEPSASPSRKP